MADNVKTPEFRVSFPEVFSAKSFDGGDAKFSIVALFAEGADLSRLKALATATAKEKWGENMPPNLRSPFRDGSEKPDLSGYEGCTFITMSSKMKPGVVDINVQPIIEASEFYGGCYAIASVTCYAYGGPGTKYRPGVSFGLQNLQKLRDGDPFGSKTKPEDDFEPVATDVTGEGTAAVASDEDIFG